MDLALNNLQRFICHKTQTNKQFITIIYDFYCEGARGVMVIVVGNEHGHTSSNPRRD